MSDKGIIFSAPMVRALLDGRKTQTRRLLNPQPVDTARLVRHVGFDRATGRPAFNFLDAADRPIAAIPNRHGLDGEYLAPHAPADRLYVREAWQVRGTYTDVIEVGYRASENRSYSEYVERFPIASVKQRNGRFPTYPKYGPSIHMPRWASRLWLGVTDVRVQRLQEISEADAQAEGVMPTGWEGSDVPDQCRIAFTDLWNSLHAEPGTRWEDNPWIVAVTFDVNHRNIDRPQDV